MSMNNFSIIYPKQTTPRYYEKPSYLTGFSVQHEGNIPKNDIPNNVRVSYESKTADGFDAFVNYSKKDNGIRLEEVYEKPNRGQISRTQEVRNVNGVSEKTFKIQNYSTGKKYLSSCILDHNTGIETVARKCDTMVVGGYEVIKPTEKTFARGIKGGLQKLGMMIASDANGCERPILRNLGEMFLKVAKFFK